MAGHSHWANIAAKKSRIDKKRSKLFGKLSRAIIVAAQMGGGDPDANLALRYAIDKARKNSMPNDNIDRAIQRGLGGQSGDSFEEVIYEGYGPHGVAVLCDILTDNRNRTASEVRKIFEVHGGNLGSTNCVAFMFDRKGLFLVPTDQMSEEQLIEIALEAGAEDVHREGENFQVTCDPKDFSEVSRVFEEQNVPTEVGEISRIPQNVETLADVKSSVRVLKLMEALEDNDDVQNVTANFEIPDDLMPEVSEAME